jgi:Ca2+-binding RTX toxin-like protein
MATYGTVTIDGAFGPSEWTSFRVDTPANSVAGYSIFGTVATDATGAKTFLLAVNGDATQPVLSTGTTFFLNIDQNSATGALTGGSEFYVQLNAGIFYLYNSTFNLVAQLDAALSSDGRSAEIAIPQILLASSTGAMPAALNFEGSMTGGGVTQYLPGTTTLIGPQYVITDPATIQPVDHSTKKIAIVWSEVSALNFYKGATDDKGNLIDPRALYTNYADLFMAAQHQAEAAGVAYDILTADQIASANPADLRNYSALLFPSMDNVKDAAQAGAITNVLYQLEHDYHVGVITSGNFMTKDANDVALAGDSYASMKQLLGLTFSGLFGTGDFTVNAHSTTNPITAGYGAANIGGESGLFAGDTAGRYTGAPYESYVGVGSTTVTSIADINFANGTTPLQGVVQTTTGGTNTHFATTQLMGDSNLLQHVIQDAVFGSTSPALALHTSRMSGIVASRTDLDQSQFAADIAPTTGEPGIYDKLMPLLDQWKAKYNFVGSYYINVGDGANPENGNENTLALAKPYYQRLLQLGNEIGSHSLTHLIESPTIQADGSPVPPNPYWPAPTTLWSENTNYLYTTPPSNGSAPNWTYAYEFGNSNTLINSALGIQVAGAAVPGAGEWSVTSHNIEQFYQSTATQTGYVSGGWTGVGAGFANAFGYITPNDQGSVYIAPNMTFDFTEVGFQHKTPAQTVADWLSLAGQLSANSQSPILVWPWHDYGPTNWVTDTGVAPGYTAQMYEAFIAYAAGYDVTVDATTGAISIGATQTRRPYEFVTSEDLAARIAAQQKAVITETTNGNVVTVSVSAPTGATLDFGAMALDVVNGGTNKIVSAGSWYAYDDNSLFLARNGVSNVAVTLGATPADATHISSLPMRTDLVSVSGDGSKLDFTITGDGVVGVKVKTPGDNIVSIQGAPAATLIGADLQLAFSDTLSVPSSAISTATYAPLSHSVTVNDKATAVTSAGDDIIFGGAANDTFAASAGNDSIDGGIGTDTALLSGLLTDYTYEASGTGIKITDKTAGRDGADNDINIERFQFSDGLTMTQSQLLAVYNTVTLTTGNDIYAATNTTNLLVYALAGNDTLTATTTANIITVFDGAAGDDTFQDTAAATAQGAVIMSGGDGNDTYIVSKARDLVQEMANGGSDTVRTALAAYTLADNVENISLTGAANQTISGNASDNVFSGFHATSTLDGAGGADTAVFTGQLARYTVTTTIDGIKLVDMRAGSPDGSVTLKNFESFQFSDGAVYTAAQLGSGATPTTPTIVNGDGANNTLSSTIAGALVNGLGGADTLTAGASGQTLNGGVGADTLSDAGFSGITLIGGAGNDTYIVNNTSTVAPTVVQEIANEGNDTVITTLSSFVLPTNVENLTFAGAGDFTATATAAGQRITGSAGSDFLSDGGFANVRLSGGAGGDTYVVASASTTIADAALNAGADTVVTSIVNYSLGNNIENLTYTGSATNTMNGNGSANIITGGSGADTIFGNGGADTLIGGLGNDRLSGGGGKDTFVFAPGFGSDTITDFQLGTSAAGNHDILDLHALLFASPTDFFAHIDAGANAVIHSGADTITIQGVTKAQLMARPYDFSL